MYMLQIFFFRADHFIMTSFYSNSSALHNFIHICIRNHLVISMICCSPSKKQKKKTQTRSLTSKQKQNILIAANYRDCIQKYIGQPPTIRHIHNNSTYSLVCSNLMNMPKMCSLNLNDLRICLVFCQLLHT